MRIIELLQTSEIPEFQELASWIISLSTDNVEITRIEEIPYVANNCKLESICEFNISTQNMKFEFIVNNPHTTTST